MAAMGVKWVSKHLDICPKTCYNRSRGYRLVSSFGTKRPWVRIPSPRPSKTACKPLKYVVFRLFLFLISFIVISQIAKNFALFAQIWVSTWVSNPAVPRSISPQGGIIIVYANAPKSNRYFVQLYKYTFIGIFFIKTP